MAARSQGIADTLRFIRKSKVAARVVVSNPDTSGIVVKIGADSPIAWNDLIAYGSVYDARDGQAYRTVTIGNQVWMAENLNYSSPSGSTGGCYNSSADSCTKYGRLYSWAEVMNGAASSTTSPSGVRGICPNSWHAPSDSEWTTMQIVVNAMNTTNGTKLTSTSGWYNGSYGTDTYGFRALPGGYDYFFSGYRTSDSYVGVFGYWWSATETDATNARMRYMQDAEVTRTYYEKAYGFSLRCVEDYTILATVASPNFTPYGGTYTDAQSVGLSTTTSGASIYYTVDGSVPTTSSTAYTGAISVSASETINAIAVKSGMANSFVSSVGYTINSSTPTAIPWQTGIAYDTLTYGGQTYKTVKIGTQRWMAENLNYSGTSGTTGVCYNNSADSCTKYGRLYTWPEVMKGATSSATSPSGVQGICPIGWHVPSDSEWMTMQQVVDASKAADEAKLKSTAGWYSSGNGTDVYGFRALPGGYSFLSSFNIVGYDGYWWTASETDASHAKNRNIYYGNSIVGRYDDIKGNGFSLRCVED